MYSRSLWNGVSGVKSFSRAMQSVADNLANTNTVGYKSTRINFEDMLYDSFSSASNYDLQVGNGSLGSAQNMMVQGAFEDTENPLDLAINGNGFFMVQDPISEETIYYTRAGQFMVNDENYLVNSEGYLLQGYMATDGVPDTGAVTDLMIDTSMLPGIATSNVDYGINLNAEDETIFSQSVEIDPTNQNTYNAGLSFDVYDAEYNQREIQLYFQRVGATSTGAVWKVATYENQNGVAVANPAEPDNTFYMQFDGNGQLVGTSSTAAIDVSDIYISEQSFSGVGRPVSDRLGESLSFTANGLTQTYNTDTQLIFALPATAGAEVTIGTDTYTSAGTSTVEEAATELANAINSDSSRSYYAVDNGDGEIMLYSKGGGSLAVTAWDGVVNETNTSLNALVSDLNSGSSASGVIHLSDLAAAGSTITLDGTHTYTINAAASLENQATDLASQINANASYHAEAHGSDVYITHNLSGQDGNVSLATSDAAGNVVLSGATLTNGRDDSDTSGVTAETYENFDGTWSLRLLHNESGADATITLGTNTMGAGLGLDFNSFNHTDVAADGVPIEANEATQTFDFTFGYTALNEETNELESYTATQSIAVDFIPEDSTSTTMQAGGYSVFFVEGDGESSGYLTGVDVDRQGVINGLYNNGRIQVLGQLALATFVSPEDMVRHGDNLWQATEASGEPIVAVAGDDDSGMGLVYGGALELSTVDVAQEMVNMIEYQRAFQANSKSITTSDEILKVAINLKT